MAITSYELMEILADNVTADLVVWHRYHKKAIGIVEAMLDYNPQLSIIHQTTLFIPPGTLVMVPIDLTLLSNDKRVAASSSSSNIWQGPVA